MERIFVTGATSMIGSALVSESLANGVEVYAMVRKNSPKIGRLPVNSRLHLVEGDLDALGELPAKVPVRIDTFYHIAWGHTGAKRNERTELQADNIRTTLQAIRVAAEMGAEKFIGAGSQAEYGPKDLEMIGPDTETNPVTPYGAAKLAAGLLGRMLAHELGIAFIWPRIFSTYDNLPGCGGPEELGGCPVIHTQRNVYDGRPFRLNYGLRPFECVILRIPS